jgi:VWFA-related protein
VRLRVLCVAAVLAAVAAHTQVAPRADASEFLAPAVTISKTVDEVNLSFTVTDKKGRFVGDLGPNDFRLLDNEQSPERLTFFQQRSDLPLHLAVLIDASASVEYRFKFETDAAAAFLKDVLRPSRDRLIFRPTANTAGSN